MTTRPVRIPGEMSASLRTLAALTGESQGSLLAQAFHEYLINHREEFAEAFVHAQKYIASSDVAGLSALLGKNRRARAEAAAAQISDRRD